MALPPRLPPAGHPTAARHSGHGSRQPPPPSKANSGLPERRVRNRPGKPAITRMAFGTMEVRPEPPWQPREAPSDTPGGPWVTDYRIWRPGVYDHGIVSEPLLDLKFKDGHEHRYQVPYQVIRAAEDDPTGRFVHRVLLGKGWTPTNRQSRYPNWPLN